MKRWEKLALLLFFLLFALSATILLRRFYTESTELVPMSGGTYIEGSVGTIRTLNPWFTVTNDVNGDIVSLVFSGLQRFNPFSGTIEDDMATLEITGGNQIYTVKLRDNLFWHDSTPSAPKPVTADDVLFTYQTIQKQGFGNPILQKNFRGVEIEKIDDRTVQFRLKEPYYFFRSNLTLGILPRHLLEDVPADRLPEALDFNLAPVGSGPYKFKSMVDAELATEVTLEQFPEYYGSKPYINRIVFRAFPNYPSLLSDLRNLDGVRSVPRNKIGKAIIPDRYHAFYYSLPQYVALFFNLDHGVLQDQKLRLGLQLATDKQAIVKTINERVIVDTPLLEFAQDDWQYQFQPDLAQGALFDSNWNLPEKLRLQHLQENQEKNATGSLILPQPIVLLETGASITFTGFFLGKDHLSVHGIPVERVTTDSGSGTWTVSLPTTGGTGSIVMGENALRLTESGGKILDTFILTRAADNGTFEALREEQKIVELYADKTLTSVTISDLRMDGEYLRLKKDDSEPFGIRVNAEGKPLRIRLLTSALPPAYKFVAEEMQKQWRAIGADVVVEVPEDRKEFEDRVLHRDYDVLLFGQPLLDNLDSYPYWHSSQIQVSPPAGEETSDAELRLDANNLSQYKSFRADALLEKVRETHDNAERERALEELREVFKEDVPAVVLYSPLYVFAVSEDILGVDLGKPSLHSDRFLSLHRWFMKQGRSFRAGKSWWSFFPWLLTL
jgi:ABC-type transport system substrate-binding protein